MRVLKKFRHVFFAIIAIIPSELLLWCYI